MKLINSSVEILPQESGLIGAYKQIEIAGRTCYKSEDKITDTSYIPFVEMLKKRGHTAPLEQGTVYLRFPCDAEHLDVLHKYDTNPYSVVHQDPKTYDWLVTTNFRVIFENNWEDDLKYFCDPSQYHEHRTTVRFILSIGIANEFVRHRVFSFCQESSRYCNYSTNKELMYIIPYWLENTVKSGTYHFDEEKLKYINVDTRDEIADIVAFNFLHSLEAAELIYNVLVDDYKCLPQEAREVLPKATKTELVMTGFNKDWKQFFKLRCAQAAHPDARKLACDLQKILMDDVWNNPKHINNLE